MYQHSLIVLSIIRPKFFLGKLLTALFADFGVFLALDNPWSGHVPELAETSE